MIDGIQYNQWAAYFSEFNRGNRWRATRLVVCDQTGEKEIERGMPFVGISLQAIEGSTRIHIMLGDHDATDPRHQTFTITGVKRVRPKCGPDGRVDALEIEDEQGETNLLLFEPRPVACSIGPNDEPHPNFGLFCS